MGEIYRVGENIFLDIVMEGLIGDVKISSKKNKKKVTEIFKYILENTLDNPKDVLYLDFDIIKDGVLYELVGNNIISALWLSGYIINDVLSVMSENKAIIGDRICTYNEKKRKLIFNAK